MSRPSLRRTPKLEILEIRQVLSTVVGPTPDQQYALELINLVRTNPSAAATMLTANITPNVQATLDHYGLTVSGLVSKLDSATAQPPLAWSDHLASAAQAQSQYQANNGIQTHQGPGQASLTARIGSTGYSGFTSVGENTYAYADSIDEAMQSFLFDWGVSDDGHYNNLLQPGVSPENAYKDVGIALVSTSNGGVGPLVLTQDFGTQQNEGPQILGVVYNDPNKTGHYTEGAGQAGVTIDAVNLSTGQDYQTQSMSAGGYQVPVAPNAYYKVTETLNGQVIARNQVYVGDVNAMDDFANNPSHPPVAPPVTPPSIPAPAPAPTPTPAPSAPSNGQSSQSQHFSAQQVLSTTPPQQQDQSSTQNQPVASSVPTLTASTTPSWMSKWSRWKVGQS